MYTLMKLDDGTTELQVLAPKTVAVFLDYDLAVVVMHNLNGARNISAKYDDQHASTSPSICAGTGDVVAKTCDEAEGGAETLTPCEVDPSAEAWNAAFREIATGGSFKEIAQKLGVTTNKLRGRYGSWVRLNKGSQAKTPPQAVASANNEVKVSASAIEAKSHAAPEPVEEVKPAWWRALDAELNALGYRNDWSRTLDLALVEGLAAGKPMALLADELGKEIGQAKARFIALTPNGVTVEKQTQLLHVLRARAEAA